MSHHERKLRLAKLKPIRGRLKHAKDQSDEDVWAPSITTRESEMREHSTKPLKKIETETLIVSEREEIKFKTGSRYKGGWNTFGMAGYGEYTMFHGVAYHGDLDDGKFHGMGTMWYPNNSRVEGIWNKGRNVQRKYYFNDGLVFDEKDWSYCKSPDRRFMKEYKSGIRPAGRTLMSNRIPPRPIPPGCYDVGDGFYSPVTKCVTHPKTGKILRIPPKSEEKWILENCRKSSGLDMYMPQKKPYSFNEDEEGSIASSRTISVTSSMTEESDSHSEIEDKKIIPEKHSKMVNKSVGRFALLHKKVRHKAYGTKYIFVDEIENRACKKHRLYLPAIKVKQKVSVVPDLRVMPPFKCIHDRKAITCNKLIVLLKMLKECEIEGGMCKVNSETRTHLKKQFEGLIQNEKRLQEAEDTSIVDSISLQSVRTSPCVQQSVTEANGSDVNLQKESKVLAFKEGDEKRSVYKLSDHKAIRAKELANRPSYTPPDGFRSFQHTTSAVDEERHHAHLIRIKEKNECEVCLSAEQEKRDWLKQKKVINDMIKKAELEERKLQEDSKKEKNLQRVIEQMVPSELVTELDTSSSKKRRSAPNRLCILDKDTKNSFSINGSKEITSKRLSEPTKDSIFKKIIPKEKSSDNPEKLNNFINEKNDKTQNFDRKNTSNSALLNEQGSDAKGTILFEANPQGVKEITSHSPEGETNAVEVVTLYKTSQKNETISKVDPEEQTKVTDENTSDALSNISDTTSYPSTPVSDITPTVESDFSEGEIEK